MMQAQNYFELEVKQNIWFHAYLLIGENKDRTKELVDYIIKSKGCLPADLSEVAPENISGKKGELKVEQIKSLLHQVSMSPLGKCRIAVVYDCERLNQSSGNMLLKTLEEPPSDLTFILVAKNNSVLPTIKSRCRLVQVRNSAKEGTLANEHYTKILSANFIKASKEIENIVKNNEIDAFLDELESFYREKLLSEKKSFFSNAISRIEEIKGEIANNANPRLALESLHLMLKSINNE